VRTVGVKLFINARTDVYLNQVGKPESWVEETISRATKYQAAGADGLFVPGITEASAIRADVVLVQPGLYSTQLYNNIKAPADAERNDAYGEVAKLQGFCYSGTSTPDPNRITQLETKNGSKAKLPSNKISAGRCDRGRW
jgi:hypothetical protein